METDGLFYLFNPHRAGLPRNQVCLAIRFGRIPELNWLSDIPGESLQIGSSLFQRHKLSLPHYDWLRTTDGQVIGVRYWPFEEKADAEFVRTFFSAVAGVCEQVVEEEFCIEIFFSEARVYDSEWSCDQAFGTAEIYCGEAGDFALVLGTDWLDETQITRLRASNFNWMNQ